MTKGITRIQGGWLARHYWGKPTPLSESFYDHEYGSREAADAAAARWLERIAKEYPAPEKRGRKPIMGNVKDEYSGKVGGFYVAWTSKRDGKQHQKTFNASVYGSIESANEAAKSFLRARTEEYESD